MNAKQVKEENTNRCLLLLINSLPLVNKRLGKALDVGMTKCYQRIVEGA